MSTTDPRMIERVYPPQFTARGWRYNRDHATGAGKLLDADLVWIPELGRFVMAEAAVAGLPRYYGPVADEAAMLALHAPTAYPPRWVAAGDKCRRADTGAVMVCVSGNGTSAADWIALASHESVTALTAAVGDIEAEIADLATTSSLAALSDEVDGKWDAPANAAALARITASTGNPPLWDGSPWPGGSGGSVSLTGEMLADSPLALWPLTDASGALADISGAGRDLSVTGSLARAVSPLLAPDPVAQWSGVVYASRSGSIGLTTPWTGSWTVEAGVCLVDTPTAAGIVLYQFGVLGDETEAGNAQVFAYITSDRIVRVIWEHGGGSNVAFAAASTPLQIGVGYLVGIRKDASASTLAILLNGRVVSSAAYTQQPTGGGSGYSSIGAASTGGSVNAALLGPVAVYASALPLSRLRAHAIAASCG